MKIMVAVPTTDYVHADFVQSVGNLCIELAKQGIEVQLRIISATLVYIARERLAFNAVNEGFTHVLWIDSDMTFETGVLDDLLFCGKDMVCGAFVSRRPAYEPCVYTSIEKNNIKKVEEFGTEPFRVAGCGFAMVLTTTELLEAVHDKFKTCFCPTDYYSEDLAFCWRVNEIGREIWCEPTVRPGHIAHLPVYAGNTLNAVFGGGAEQ